jgi:hypothetical protein
VSGIVETFKHHYIQTQWPKRESLIPGQKNVNTPLINPEEVAQQTWTHENFKAMDQNSAGFVY